MPRNNKRRSPERHSIFSSGDKIPTPDYFQFQEVCNEAGRRIGMDGNELYKLYRRYIEYSLKLAFPEDKPRDLNDDQLLNPRRIIQIRGIASAEVTPSSLWGWRQIEQRINNKKNKNL